MKKLQAMYGPMYFTATELADLFQGAALLAERRKSTLPKRNARSKKMVADAEALADRMSLALDHVTKP